MSHLFRRSISALLILQLLIQIPFSYAGESAPAETSTPLHEKLFGKTAYIREKGNCGIYLAPATYTHENGKPVRLVNNSSGYKLATLDVGDPEKSLHDLQAALWQASTEGGDRAVDGDLAITGLPMWDQFSKDFQIEVGKILDELSIDKKLLRIIPMYVPRGTGIKRIAQETVGLLPLPQDVETPIQQEKQEAVIGALSAEVFTAGYAVTHFTPKEWAPMLLIHFVATVGLVAYLRTVSNWQNRSPGFASKAFKQALTGLVFIANFDITANWPKILQAAQTGHADVRGALDNLGHNALEQAMTPVAQAAFFMTTFAYGVYRWEAMRSRTPEEALKARRAKSLIIPAVYWFGGPMLLWASTSTEVFAQLGPVPLNPGQAGLLGLAVLGSAFYFKPEILDVAASWLDKYAYPLLDSAKAQLKSMAVEIKQLFKIEKSPSP